MADLYEAAGSIRHAGRRLMLGPQWKRGDSVEWGRVVDAVRGRWLLVLLLALSGIAMGSGLALLTSPTYVSTATVLLRWVGPNSGHATTENIRYLGGRAPTYSVLVERPSVLSEAIEKSGVELTVAELAGLTETAVPIDSQVIQIRTRSPVPDHAMKLVNATADALVNAVALEERGAVSGKANVDAVVAVRGQAPLFPDTPRVVMYVAAGALFGLALGVLTTIMVALSGAERLRRRPMLPIPRHSRIRQFGLAHLAWAAMISATIPWRSNTFYESGADSVVIAKAALSMLALVISFWAYKSAGRHHPIPATPILLLTAYLSVTVIGGLANWSVSSAVVVAMRVVILMTTIILLVATYGPSAATRALIQMLVVLASIAALSGAFTFTGRLGGILHPNALAFATAVVAIWLWSRVLSGDDHGWELFALALCLTVVLLTGSRSALAAFGVTAVIMTVRITAMRYRTLVVLAVGLPIITYVVAGTDLIKSIFLRGGSGQVATLSNRTIAWEAALNLQRDFWQTWFGQGLEQKKIGVPGQWWDTQLLDSSWISALIQGGNFGAVLALLLGLSTLFYAAFAPRKQGAIWLGLALMTTLTGILESGLLDGSLLFMVFWVASLGAFSAQLDGQVADPPERHPTTLTRRVDPLRSPAPQLL